MDVDDDPAVCALAERMGIRSRRGLAREIRRVVIGNLEQEMHRFNMVPRSLDEVLEIVAGLRGMEFVHVESDADFVRIETEYGAELPALERQLAFEFNAATEAVVLRRPHADARSSRRYLAVVDARGHRANKAWYGDRHEAVHVLLPDNSNQQMFRRTSAERPEPFEQVVDFVASRLGFWPPIVVDPLRANLRSGTDVLDAFERTRTQLAPNASIEAAFRAFADHVGEPLLIVWSDFATRKRGGAETLALRVQNVIVNDAALRTGLFVPRNYRVPAHSVITRAHRESWGFLHMDTDSLDRWTDSSGRKLSSVPLPVSVTARGRWAALQLRR